MIETPKARLLGVPSNPLARYLEVLDIEDIYIYIVSTKGGVTSVILLVWVGHN